MNAIPTAMELILDPSCGLDMEGKFKLFAQMHVRNALETASENATIEEKNEGGVGFNRERYVHSIVKESILNAYPLTNIK